MDCPLPMATVEADFASGAPPLPDSDEEKPPIPQVTRSMDGFIAFSCFFSPKREGLLGYTAFFGGKYFRLVIFLYNSPRYST